MLPLSLCLSEDVRAEEKKILERAGLVQSLTVGVAPVVVVMASVCTFTLHMALGYDLTASQVRFSSIVKGPQAVFALHRLEATVNSPNPPGSSAEKHPLVAAQMVPLKHDPV